MLRAAFITALLALGCTPTTPSTEPSPTPEPSDANAKAQQGTIKLTHFEKTLTIETGTELHYSFRSYASVGYGADFEIGDPTVLEHLRTDMQYVQSEEERAGKAGADEATGTYVFVARSPGSSTLRVREMFRGDPELELEYAITVVAP